ncbi:hypothetical protein [Streptomyces rimosus]|uniref:hypothetical protein n=1 Tax=Streptomyces rimosus TaxID=1927 RepID=UPI003CD04C1A
MSDAGRVVSGVQRDQDVRVARLPLAGFDELLDDRADLDGGHRGDIGAGLQADRAARELPDGYYATTDAPGQGLLLGDDTDFTEATGAHLFFAKDGALHTPTTRCTTDGTSRACVPHSPTARPSRAPSVI